MCSGTDAHLESIDDFVFNQDKIVTYRWLSKKLNIHTNTSKQLLYSFCQKNAKGSLSVTHLVTGRCEDGVKVFVISASRAEEVKKSLDRVLSEHVYSVQKASTAASSDQIFLADSTVVDSSHRLSSISCRELEERDFKVSSNRVEKTGGGGSVSGSGPTLIQPVASKGASLKAAELKSRSTEAKVKEEPVASRDEDTSPPAAKHRVTAKSPVKNRNVTSTNKHLNKRGESKGGGIGAFFNKQTANEKKDATSKAVASNIKDQKVQVSDGVKAKEPLKDGRTEKVLQEKPEDSGLDLEVCDQPANKTPVAQKKKRTGKASSKKRKKSREEDMPERKRKRIVLASDSESEEEEEEEDVYMEEVEEPGEDCTPLKALESEGEDEIIPPTPFGEKPKKRVRKQVDRTFVDDDGFVITEKAYVYASGSEEEGESSAAPVKKAEEEKEKENVADTKEEVKEERGLKLEEEKAEGETKTGEGGKGRKGRKPVAGGKSKSKSKSPKKAQPLNSKQQSSITCFFKRK